MIIFSPVGARCSEYASTCPAARSTAVGFDTVHLFPRGDAQYPTSWRRRGRSRCWDANTLTTQTIRSGTHRARCDNAASHPRRTRMSRVWDADVELSMEAAAHLIERQVPALAP